MSIFNKKKICVTHNGSFHADDIFATAVLSILNNGNIKIIRTRDPRIFDKGDYVYDVGGENDFERNKFDHHQKGGAGNRDNGIPYSSFGLVWKKYGEQICGDKEIVNRIDTKIVQPIDANDNGVDIYRPIYKDLHSYSVYQIFLSESPTWKENNSNIDDIFIKQVEKAVVLLKREIKIAGDDLEGKKMIIEAYNKSKEKRVISVDFDLPRYLMQETLCKFDEPIFFVYPSFRDNKIIGWKTEAVRKSRDTMESRKLFPESWRGLMENSGKLKEVTGVSDAGFCHTSGFFLTAGSKEGAIKLAEKALIA
jgi:uncharacterized UPF0160 family protein